MAVRHKFKGIPCGAVHGSAFSEHYICTRIFGHPGDHVEAEYPLEHPEYIRDTPGDNWVFGQWRCVIKKKWSNRERQEKNRRREENGVSRGNCNPARP